MSSDRGRPRVFVVYGDQASYDEAAINRLLRESEQKPEQDFDSENVSGQKANPFPRAAHDSLLARIDRRPVYDAHQVHRSFPARWQSYIRSNFSDLRHVQLVFNVSERTARKWWNGETGANGGHVAIAVNEHPVSAPRMLFAAE